MRRYPWSITEPCEKCGRPMSVFRETRTDGPDSLAIRLQCGGCRHESSTIVDRIEKGSQ